MSPSTNLGNMVVWNNRADETSCKKNVKCAGPNRCSVMHWWNSLKFSHQSVVFKQNGIAVLSTRYRIFSIWRCELQFKIYKRAGTVQKDNSKTTADTSRLYGNHSSLKSLTEINLWLNRNYSNTTKEMCITERTSRPFYSYTHIWNHRR